MSATPLGAGIGNDANRVHALPDLDAIDDHTCLDAAGTTRAELRAADSVLNRIVEMTQALHASLHGLGLDKSIERAAATVPDAVDRLDFVMRTTRHAADSVLNAVETATPLQHELERAARDLDARWTAAAARMPMTGELQTLVEATRSLMQRTVTSARLTREQLVAIMTAQEFQDLTGQALRQVATLTGDFEQQLLKLLGENRTVSRTQRVAGGPVIDARDPGTVPTQAQVDDLLDEIGF